jgi:hypothetical protein
MSYYRYGFIKTIVKFSNTDIVSVMVKWVNQWVISWLCVISKRSCKYWYVIKRAQRLRTGIDVFYRTTEVLTLLFSILMLFLSKTYQYLQDLFEITHNQEITHWIAHFTITDTTSVLLILTTFTVKKKHL